MKCNHSLLHLATFQGDQQLHGLWIAAYSFPSHLGAISMSDEHTTYLHSQVMTKAVTQAVIPVPSGRQEATFTGRLPSTNTHALE